MPTNLMLLTFKRRRRERNTFQKTEMPVFINPGKGSAPAITSDEINEYLIEISNNLFVFVLYLKPNQITSFS